MFIAHSLLLMRHLNPAASTCHPALPTHQTLHCRLLRLLPPRGSRCCCAATASRGALLLPLPEHAKQTVPPFPAQAGHGSGSFCSRVGPADENM